jgi:hypothetical protein
MVRRFRSSYCLLCLGVLAGCQSADEPLPAPKPIAVTPAPAPTAPAKPANAAHAPDLANPKVTSAQAAEFKPPFPERPERELFEPPKQARSNIKRDDEHGQTVELKGFINVDKPSVVLKIDNAIAIIPEGGEKYGVRVRSIQPPTVILERGRNRWPATLE